MFLSLFTLCSSVKPEKYRRCDQSPFCPRGRFVNASLWSIQKDSIQTKDNVFQAIIDDGKYNTQLSLNIAILKTNTLHIKIKPLNNENFNRFDIDLEPTLIDQQVVNDLSEINVEKTPIQATISSSSAKLFVFYQPFKIVSMDSNGEAFTMNFNDTGIYETQRDKEKYPDLYNEHDFNGFHDVFPNGPTSVAMSFRFSGKQTRISGLPSHTLPLSLSSTLGGEPIRFWNTDINEYAIGNGMSMYGAVPILFAHSLERTQSLYWANPSETWVDIDHSEDKSYSDVRFISEGGHINVYLFLGTPAEISNSMTQLTGRPLLPPLFGIAYHQCRWGYMTQQDFLEVSEKLDESGVPHDVMWLDLDHADDRKYFTFHQANFPNPKKMFEDFAKNNRYVVTLVDPHLKGETSYPVYKEAKEKGLLMKTRGGDDYRANCWPGQSSWPDYMNPQVRSWWETLFSFSHYKDSAPNCHIWNDMNEISVFDSTDNSCPRDLVHYGSIEEREVHNIYGHMMVSSTWGGLRKRTEKPLRPFILTRSFFAGSQKYSFVWTGDNAAEWSHLQNSIPNVLSYGLTGIVYAGADVGGFFNSPDDNLLSRWFSVGAWTYSFFREHCHHLAAMREIYNIKDEVSREVAKSSIIERYQMLPYWYTLSREANTTGKPIVRPLWYEFPTNKDVLDVDDQVMLGSHLLVVPFLEKDKSDRKFVKPSECEWYNFRTLQKYETNNAKFDDGRTLVLIKEGSIVPMKCRIRKASKMMFFDPFTLVIAADKQGKAQGEVYADDGESEDFGAGQFVHRQFVLEDGKITNKAVVANNNKFVDNYDVKVEKIRIAGVNEPTKVVGPNGEIEFEYVNGVLIIKNPNLLVRDEWTISLQ